MEIEQSELLSLRVFAITTRLQEVSEDVSKLRGEAYELRQQIEEETVSSLMTDPADRCDADHPLPLEDLKASLIEREAVAQRQEAEEVRLKGVLLTARREHLRQLKREHPRRWMILE